MAGQKITIHLQNVIGYLKFLMAYPNCRHNQTYEASCIYNKNKKQVYNKIHSNE